MVRCSSIAPTWRLGTACGLLLTFRRSPRICLSCRRPKKPVDLAEIANCFHVAAVHPIHETILRANDSHTPLPTFGKSNRNRNTAAPQKACRSGRDSQLFSCGGGTP